MTIYFRWFAERCDRIILLFDINKLDISDELRAAIDMVKGKLCLCYCASILSTPFNSGGRQKLIILNYKQ